MGTHDEDLLDHGRCATLHAVLVIYPLLRLSSSVGENRFSARHPAGASSGVRGAPSRVVSTAT
jgi:hypothetical protein